MESFLREKTKQALALIPREIKKRHREQEKLRIWQIPQHDRKYEDFLRAKQDCWQKLLQKNLDPRIKKIGGFLVCGLIWLVDGNKVRSKIDIDFTCGGHAFRYLYIPSGEVWIDSGLKKEDLLPTIWHELIEFRFMQHGMDYNDAHDIAAQAEMMIREGKAKQKESYGTVWKPATILYSFT